MRVPPDGRVYVLGDVRKSGASTITDNNGTTVLKPDRLPSEVEPRWSSPQGLVPSYAEFEPAKRSVSPYHYLLVIWRQRWKILSFVACAMLAAYLVSGRLAPVYEATVKIDLDRAVPAADAFMATEMEILKLDAVLRPVAERYGLLEKEGQIDSWSREKVRRKNDAPVVLQRLKITRVSNTYLLNISYSSTDPQLAADVANGIAQSYLEYSFDTRTKFSSAQSAFMQRQLDDVRARMERSTVALANFQQHLNVTNPEEKTNILSSRLLQLNADYSRARADRRTKEFALKAAQAGTVAEDLVTDRGPDLSRLRERVDTAKQHLADVASVYGPKHAEYRKASSELDELERQIEELETRVTALAEADYKKALSNETMLRRAIDLTKSEYDLLTAHSFEYQQLKRDADGNKALYSDLERRIREAALKSTFHDGSIRVADAARPPDEPVFPNKKLNLLLAFFVSSIVGMCIAIVADVVEHTSRDPEQASSSIDTRVLGTSAPVKEMRRLTAGSAHEAISYEQAIRTLHHSIFLPNRDRTIKSILITSATPGEGKSTAIIRLGIAHAEEGKRTLIIDADLSRASIYKELGVSGTPSLSHVLFGEFQWREMIIKMDQWSNLELIPSGMISRFASGFVGSMVVDILKKASREYDLILIDGPSLIGSSEAMHVAEAVDGVVVITCTGEAGTEAVATVLAILKRLRANVVGLVLDEVSKAKFN